MDVSLRSSLALSALAEKDGLVDLKMKMEDQPADEAGHAEEMR